MKSILESSLTDLKQSHADTPDSHLKEMTIEPHRLKKTGNGDQYRFNLKVGGAVKEAKEACSSKQFDNPLRKVRTFCQRDRSTFFYPVSLNLVGI